MLYACAHLLRAYGAANGYDAARIVPRKTLLGLFMLGVLFAERAVLGNGDPVGIVALVLEAVVIPVLALGAFKGYFGSY